MKRQFVEIRNGMLDLAKTLLGLGNDEVAVEAGDVIDRDAFRASGFAFVEVGAVAEAFYFHLVCHGEYTLGTFRLALRKEVQRSDFRRGEEHGRGVFAGGNARSTSNAGGGVKCFVSFVLFNLNVVGIRCGTSADVYITASGDDAVKSSTVNDEVTKDRECLSAEGLNPDGVAILELAHVELAGGDFALRTVRYAVNGQRAHAANAFTAIVVKVDGFLVVGDESFIDDIEHFQEGGVLGDIGRFVGFDAAFGLGIFLTPDLEGKIEGFSHNESFLLSRLS